MQPAGALFRDVDDHGAGSPLLQMNIDERLAADFNETGVTIGGHPVGFARQQLTKIGVTCAADLERMRDVVWVKNAGGAIVRQRAGRAKGFMFASSEDETGDG